MGILQPKLRFPEFKGDWKIYILKDIATFSKGKGISKSDISIDGKYECIRYGQLYTVYGETISNVISKTNVDKKDLIFSNYNDVIIPASGETQLDIATASCILKDGVALGGDLNIIKTKNNGVFISYYLNNSKKEEIASLAQGVSVVHLYSSQLSTLKLNLPSLQEQTKIANFLSSIDEKINLLKEKKALFEEYKKGIMQKIFNQEIRFKDDNGNDFEDWEEKALGEVGEFQTSSVDKLIKEGENEVYLVNYMNVYKHENINNESKFNLQIVTAKENQIISSNLKKGDILFTPSSETPDDIGHSVVIFEDLESCVYSYHLMRFRPKIKIDIMYSHYFCNNSKVLSQLSRLATGSTRFTISVKSFSSIKVDLPCLKEQIKIANFLSAIDEKIALLTNQIKDTQEYKKGLLQQMFV